MCIKKFLGCFQSRISCIVLAYAGIASSVLVLGWFTYYFREAAAVFAEALRTNTFELEYEPGEEHLSKEEERLAYTLGFSYIVAVVGCYFFVHGLFIIFSIFLAIGAHSNKRGLVKAYFVYGFFHFFFMLFLASLHFYIDEYVETAVVVVADIFFAFCLCGVKGMMDSVSNGQVYSQPTATGYKP